MDEKEAQQILKANSAAMYAVAEELQKSNTAREVQEAIAIQKQAQEDVELAKAQTVTEANQLVQQITKAVVVEIAKANSIYGEKENLELNGDEMRDVTHKDVFYSEGGDEDKQVDAKDTNKTDEVQQTLHAGGAKSLQLMIKKQIEATLSVELKKHFLKEHEAQYAGNDDVGDVGAVEEEVMVEPAEEEMAADMDVEPDGADEYPMEEDEYDEDSFKNMYKSLKKQIDKSMADLPDMVMKQAEKLSEKQLLKSGFRKEISKQPQITKAMGLDDTDYAIQKSQDSEAFDIDKVSFADLYSAKLARDKGIGTEGLPEDFFRN